MLLIRDCPGCRARVRTAVWAIGRTGRCPYCKAEMPLWTEPQERIAPTWAERTAWFLGLLTEFLGVTLPLAFLIAHDRFAMNWLGGSLVALILALLILTVGRVSRLGAPNEFIVLNNVALVLLWALVLYGSLAFAPLDALGGSAMVILATFCIVMAGVFDTVPGMSEKSSKGRFSGWLLLLTFSAAYAYHAFQPWIRR